MLTKYITKMGLVLVVLLTAFTAQADVVVIVNANNGASMDAKSIKRIFLGKEKKFSDGSESIPINQDASRGPRQQFDSNVLGRSSSQISAYWSKQVFTGKGVPPKEVPSDAEVIEIVAKNPSAIGYIDSASVTDAVKVVTF